MKPPYKYFILPYGETIILYVSLVGKMVVYGSTLHEAWVNPYGPLPLTKTYSIVSLRKLINYFEDKC